MRNSDLVEMKIHHDDERRASDGWLRVYRPDQAIEILKSGEVIELSLDHYLGDEDRGTGYDCCALGG